MTIGHFPLCSPRILFSAFPGNISLIGTAQRMSNLQKQLLLPVENSAEMLFASQTFLVRMSFFYKFDYSHANCFCNCLAPNFCNTELVKSGHKTRQSEGDRFGIILLLFKLYCVCLFSIWGNKSFWTFHQMLLVKLKWNKVLGSLVVAGKAACHFPLCHSL